MEKDRCIMSFAGHMIDQPSRWPVRFPAYAEQAVQKSMQDVLLRYKPEIVVSSAACGGDLIFAEQALAVNASLYIILPFEDREDFIARSVSFAGDGWIQRFNYVCQKASAVLHIHPGGFINPNDFERNQYAIMMFTLGYGKAEQMRIINLALYDHTCPPNGLGGTQTYISLCNSLKLSLDTINLADIRKSLLESSGCSEISAIPYDIDVQKSFFHSIKRSSGELSLRAALWQSNLSLNG